MLHALPRDIVTITLTPRSKLHPFVEGVELDDRGPRRTWTTAQLPPHVRGWINHAMASAPRDTVVIVTDAGRAPMIGVVLATTTFHQK